MEQQGVPIGSVVRQRRVRTEEQILILMEEYEENGLTAKEFCELSDIHKATFYSWHGKYSKGGGWWDVFPERANPLFWPFILSSSIVCSTALAVTTILLARRLHKSTMRWSICWNRSGVLKSWIRRPLLKLETMGFELSTGFFARIY